MYNELHVLIPTRERRKQKETTLAGNTAQLSNILVWLQPITPVKTCQWCLTYKIHFVIKKILTFRMGQHGSHYVGCLKWNGMVHSATKQEFYDRKQHGPQLLL